MLKAIDMNFQSPKDAVKLLKKLYLIFTSLNTVVFDCHGQHLEEDSFMGMFMNLFQITPQTNPCDLLNRRDKQVIEDFARLHPNIDIFCYRVRGGAFQEHMQSPIVHK